MQNFSAGNTTAEAPCLVEHVSVVITDEFGIGYGAQNYFLKMIWNPAKIRQEEKKKWIGSHLHL